MSVQEIVMSVIEAVIWYLALVVLLAYIRDPKRNIWATALLLLVLIYLGFVTCPWVRETEAWQQLFR
jgi:formate hydrogenlyase subunit 3/multisubunit Na+/H+ antiporter MnhD subunit